MKKLFIVSAILFSAFSYNSVRAQVSLNVNVNIGAQPVWGPVGYDYVEYYYLPDIEAYYYVPTRQFIYLSGPNWVFAYGLPPAYRGYNLYSGYKVVINRPRAYLYHDSYRIKYKGYKGNRSQAVIRNSNNPKYYVVKGHPKYKSQGGGNKAHGGGGQAKSKGGGKGNGKGHRNR
ncbi:MAG TPA: hypothetical protein VFX58_17935 [Chitinophagaceae bacterium]|nr:hypothetical protein [Chitinophagaceae bacterium]